MPDRTAVSRGPRSHGSRPLHRRRSRSSRSSPDRARGPRSLRAETAHRLDLLPVRLYLLAASILVPAEHGTDAVRHTFDAVESLACRKTEGVATEKDVAQGPGPL